VTTNQTAVQLEDWKQHYAMCLGTSTTEKYKISTYSKLLKLEVFNIINCSSKMNHW
jgi:hypothetical protein